MDAPPLTEEELTEVYNWVDQVPLSRPKKNILRDFSDGVFVAEIMKMYYPEMVQLHNYPAVSAQNAKYSNWKTLNCKDIIIVEKVFKKLRFQIHGNDIA